MLHLERKKSIQTRPICIKSGSKLLSRADNKGYILAKKKKIIDTDHNVINQGNVHYIGCGTNAMLFLTRQKYIQAKMSYIRVKSTQ